MGNYQSLRSPYCGYSVFVLVSIVDFKGVAEYLGVWNKSKIALECINKRVINNS